MKVTATTQGEISEVMMLSLVKWAEKDLKYRFTFRKMEERTLSMISIILNELQSFKPGHVWTWWAYPANHMRFRDIKQTQKMFAHEILYQFLWKVARGDLANARKTKKKKRTAISKRD